MGGAPFEQFHFRRSAGNHPAQVARFAQNQEGAGRRGHGIGSQLHDHLDFGGAARFCSRRRIRGFGDDLIGQRCSADKRLDFPLGVPRGHILHQPLEQIQPREHPVHGLGRHRTGRAETVHHVLKMMRQGGGPLIAHGGSHPLYRMGFAEQGIDPLGVRRIFLQGNQQLAHALEMFPRFGKKHLTIFGHVHGLYLGGKGRTPGRSGYCPATLRTTSRTRSSLKGLTMKSWAPACTASRISDS